MIRYQYQTDEFVAPSTPVFDEDPWWYSVQKCSAAIAFAAAMALTQSQTAAAIQVSQQHPEEIANKFYFDEDTWRNPAPPAPQVFTRQPIVGSDELFIAALTAFDESGWQNPTRFAPSSYTAQPFNYSDDFVGPAAFALYDETWQNPMQPAVAKYLWTSPVREEDGMHFVVPPSPTGANYIPTFRRRRR